MSCRIRDNSPLSICVCCQAELLKHLSLQVPNEPSAPWGSIRHHGSDLYSSGRMSYSRQLGSPPSPAAPAELPPPAPLCKRRSLRRHTITSSRLREFQTSVVAARTGVMRRAAARSATPPSPPLPPPQLHPSPLVSPLAPHLMFDAASDGDDEDYFSDEGSDEERRWSS